MNKQELEIKCIKILGWEIKKGFFVTLESYQRYGGFIFTPDGQEAMRQHLMEQPKFRYVEVATFISDGEPFHGVDIDFDIENPKARPNKLFYREHKELGMAWALAFVEWGESNDN